MNIENMLLNRKIPTRIILDFICRAKGGIPFLQMKTPSPLFTGDEAEDLNTAPAVLERYKACLEYTDRPIYMEYVTKPSFQLKLKN